MRPALFLRRSGGTSKWCLYSISYTMGSRNVELVIGAFTQAHHHLTSLNLIIRTDKCVMFEKTVEYFAWMICWGYHSKAMCMLAFSPSFAAFGWKQLVGHQQTGWHEHFFILFQPILRNQEHLQQRHMIGQKGLDETCSFLSHRQQDQSFFSFSPFFFSFDFHSCIVLMCVRVDANCAVPEEGVFD